MEFKRTNRGFALIEFKDRYSKNCSLQKSSLATEDCVWLGVEEGDHGSDHGPFELPHGVHCLSRMHLTQDMAAELIKYLQYFVDHGELMPIEETSS